MDVQLIFAVATGSLAVCSLSILSIVFFVRRKRRREMAKQQIPATQIFHLPPKIRLSGGDDDLQRPRDPPIQDVAQFRPRMSHTPTMHSMSTGSPILSPMSRYSTDTTATYHRNSLSRTSTMTNNNNNNNIQQYHGHLASTPHWSSPPIFPASLMPGSRTNLEAANSWLPPSPPPALDTDVRRMSYEASPLQQHDPAHQLSAPLGPLHPHPSSNRRLTIDTPPYASRASLHSISERNASHHPLPPPPLPVHTATNQRYYNAKNGTRETLVHLEGTQNALPELYGSEPAAVGGRGRRKERLRRSR